MSFGNYIVFKMLKLLTRTLPLLFIRAILVRLKWPTIKLRLNSFQSFLVTTFIHITHFLPSFYRMNEKIWLEGLLVDWLQKSIFDKWVKRFLVHSSYLFSERVMFDFVVKFYIDYVIWVSYYNSIWNFNSVSNVLSFFIVFSGTLFMMFSLYSFWVLVL